MKFSLDGYIKAQYDILLQEAIPNDWDAVIIVWGKEGSGKSTKSSQAIKYLDPQASLNNVAFLPKDWDSKAENLPEESGLLYDEGVTGLNAAQWASKLSQMIIKRLTMCRRKRMKLIICHPYLYMLNKYIISRCVGSIYCYSKGFTDRGHAFFYNQDQTMHLYSMMKYKYSMNPLKAIDKTPKAFYFNFTKTFCFPYDEYEQLKIEASANVEEPDPWKQRAVQLISIAKEAGKLSDVAGRWGVTTQYLYQLMKQTNSTDIYTGE